MATILAERRMLVHEQLEATGIDLWQATWVTADFYALIPTNPRVSCELEHDEGDECTGCAIAWDHLVRTHRGPGDFSRCLWDFVELTLADATAVVKFMDRWGAADWGEDGSAGDDERAGYVLLDEIRREARIMVLALETLVETEEGRLVPLDSLETFVRIGMAEVEEEPEETAEQQEAFTAFTRRPGTSFEEYDRAKREVWQRWREKERRAGRGLDYQRRLLVSFLERWAYDTGYWLPSWKDRKRTAATAIAGAKDLVRLQLREIFSAPILDVYTCSVCARPFPFDERTGERRPRRGGRRFCGQACRTTARLESNRASWQRNKDRWRPSASGTEREGEGPP